MLIVGFGNSALDIALEAARAKRLVTILCRTGAQVPRLSAHGLWRGGDDFAFLGARRRGLFEFQHSECPSKWLDANPLHDVNRGSSGNMYTQIIRMGLWGIKVSNKTSNSGPLFFGVSENCHGRVMWPLTKLTFCALVQYNLKYRPQQVNPWFPAPFCSGIADVLGRTLQGDGCFRSSVLDAQFGTWY